MQQIIKFAVMVITCIIMIVGCRITPAIILQPICPMPQDNNLEKAIENGKSDLGFAFYLFEYRFKIR